MEARTDGERDLALVVQTRAATFARSLITHFDREFNVRARMARTIARSNITQHATCNAIERAQARVLCGAHRARAASCTDRATDLASVTGNPSHAVARVRVTNDTCSDRRCVRRNRFLADCTWGFPHRCAFVECDWRCPMHSMEEVAATAFHLQPEASSCHGRSESARDTSAAVLHARECMRRASGGAEAPAGSVQRCERLRS
jgi:hypothetical protein